MDVAYHRSDRGKRLCLVVKQGPKYVHVIYMDSAGIRVTRLRRDEQRFMEVIDYPVDTACASFRNAGERYGITSEAARYLSGEAS